MKRTYVLIVWAAIVGLAIALRVAVAAGHPTMQPDSYDYRVLGEKLATTGQYMVDGHRFVRMPGYPALLAMVFAVAGPSVKVALMVQAVLGGLLVAPVFFLARRVNDAVGLVASLLFALDPLSVAFSGALLSETAFTGALLLGLWVVVRIAERGRFGWWVVLGLLWAAGVYLRASALYLLVPLALLAAVYGEPGMMRRVGGPLVAMVVVLLALVSWQWMHIVHDRAGYLALTSLEGISLYEAVYPDADGSPKQHLLQPTAEMQGLNEMQRNDEWSRKAWGYVRQDPGRMAALAVRKMGRTWNPAFNAGELQSWPIQLVSVAWHVPLFVLGLVGVFGRSISFRIKCVLLLPVVYFTLVHALYLGSVRYRVPLMPLVCICAGAAVVRLWELRGKPKAASRV